ncbi:MAG: reductase, partial [Oscillospiraceae bacterium]|nr:reductase [Oscillospiraceae bacterium]
MFDSLAYCSNDIKALLDNVKCESYIFISTTAVYDKHLNTREEEFEPLSKPLVWCGRSDFPYDEIKRQAECAVAQEYAHIKSIAVRLPFVIGMDDYTKRLNFYVEHIINEKPMFIDNYEAQMSFVRSDEAGQFLSFLAESNFTGAINGASEQTISIKEISEYLNKPAILSNDGDKAPYNGEKEYSININRAKSLGFTFTPLKNWIYELIDYY